MDIAKQSHLNRYKFCAQNTNSLLRRAAEDYVNPSLEDTLTRLAGALNYGDSAGSRVKKSLKKFQKKKDLDASEVTLCELNPAKYLGSVSESFYANRETVSWP